MAKDDIYKKAKKRVKKKKGFFYHLIAYVGVIAMLYTIMHVDNNGQMLPVIIVALSWGIGIATHYFDAFGTEHLESFGFNANWEEEELEKEIDRLARMRELKEELHHEKLQLDELDRLELREMEKRALDREMD